MGFFEKIKQGLKKTTNAVAQSLDDLAASFVEVDDEMLEELEETLIMADLGAGVAAKATEKLRKTAQHTRIENGIALRCLLKDVLTDMMLEDIQIDLSGTPAVILVIGVNGVGKTTSIGKLAARYVQEGHQVMLAAADTFRAAAADQLEIWARRARTSSATARAQTPPPSCSTPSPQQRRAAATSSSSIPQDGCTISRT